MRCKVRTDTINSRVCHGRQIPRDIVQGGERGEGAVIKVARKLFNLRGANGKSCRSVDRAEGEGREI